VVAVGARRLKRQGGFPCRSVLEREEIKQSKTLITIGFRLFLCYNKEVEKLVTVAIF